MNKQTAILLIFCPGLLFACSKHEPVPVNQCDQVIAHAKKVLGGKAPSTAEMSKQCKAATDDARGCVLAADKPMKLLKCDF
ncbi:hypothetical protein SG34_020735 [Thalassomonas viridans]|uniref:Lipoprotein n=1 Tax=Thalassomonas viridans TaxID=137584 RepID=A0AAE9Z0E0_9GAMM|nr:hypothetical protein [Thalassomonas viridans]WDE03785.1 hypothetical protein SG34_020735 [Thalassomonas viridans]